MINLKRIIIASLICLLTLSTLPASANTEAPQLLEAYLENPNTHQKVSVPLRITSQQIQQDTLLRSPNPYDSYAYDFEATITPDMLRAAGYEFSDELWDSSSTVKAWGRIYYDKTSNKVRITKVTGNWKNTQPNRFSLKNHYVVASCTSSGNGVQGQRREWRPNGGFTYNTGFRDFAATTGGFYYIGMSMSVDIYYQNGGLASNLWLNLMPWGTAE